MAALLAHRISAHAQSIDPDAAYFTGQEEQQIDRQEWAGRQLGEMQRREGQKGVKRLNREMEASVREQQLRRLRDE
ncbi:MAG TPA: hypothetical protein VJS30_12940 [Paraburkholderia sp.]|nr:hypothetical protein [Paraburkholderia sp.]